MAYLGNLYVAGEYSTYFVPMCFKKEIVQSMLPNWLKLVPLPNVAGEVYPVIFMFGHQKDVRFQWGIFNRFGFDYEEFAVGIPYVQMAKTAQGPFYVMPRLYLNRLLPVIVGYFWGFAKETARIQSGKDSYQVKDHKNHLLISGKFKPCGKSGKPSDFPFFEEMEKQKMLQQRPLIDKTFWGSYVCVKFDRDSDQTEIQPVEANVQIATSFLPGLPIGEYQVHDINEAPLGAFRMRTPWTMSLPMKCTS